MSKYKLTLKPSNEVVLVEEGKNLLEVLRAHDIYIKSSCGGVATCSDCICKIVSGEDNLESPTFQELKLLGNVFHLTHERLLCQTKMLGDVTVDISSHDKATDEEKLKAKSGKLKAKKIQSKVRSKEEFEKIKDDRFKERKEREAKDKNWDRYWEKDQTDKNKKSLGGGKRPKFFKTDHLNLDQEKKFEDKNDDSSVDSKDFKKFRRD